MAHDIFISYATDDKEIADAMCARLEGRGIRCWYAPRDVVPGKAWSEAIVDAIEEARILVVVLSSHSNGSTHVLSEIERGVSKKLHVIPFRVEDVQPSRALGFFMNSRHWLDAMTPPLVDHLEKLGATIDVLLSHLGSGPLPAGETAPPPPAPATTPHARGIRRSALAFVVLLLAAGAIAAWRMFPDPADTTPVAAAPGSADEQGVASTDARESAPRQDGLEPPAADEREKPGADPAGTRASSALPELGAAARPAAGDFDGKQEEQATEARQEEGDGTPASEPNVERGDRQVPVSGAPAEPPAGADAEPNDSREAASPITADTAIHGDVGSDADGADWFRFVPAGDGIVAASLVNAHADPRTQDGQLQGLGAHDARAGRLAQTYPVGPAREQSLPPIAVAAGGELYFEISAKSGCAAPYVLQLAFSKLPGADGHEPNDTRSDAAAIEVPGEVTARVGFGDDLEDCYSFSPPKDGTVVVTLANTHADPRTVNGQLAGLEVEAADGTSRAKTYPFGPTKRDDTVPFSVTGGDAYRILVRPNRPGFAAPYTLGASFQELAVEPSEDQGDSPATARALPPGGGHAATVGYGDDREDWYSIEPRADGMLVITVTNRHVAKNVVNGGLAGLNLLDANQSRLDATYPINPGQPRKTRPVAVSAGARYLVAVKPQQATHQAPYDIHAAFDAMSEADAGEPNDSRAAAHALMGDSELQAKVGYGSDSEDWYSFVPERDGSIVVAASNLHAHKETANGQLAGLKLEDALGKVLRRSHPIGPGESRQTDPQEVESGKTYYVSVGLQAATNAAPYRLELRLR